MRNRALPSTCIIEASQQEAGAAPPLVVPHRRRVKLCKYATVGQQYTPGQDLVVLPNRCPGKIVRVAEVPTLAGHQFNYDQLARPPRSGLLIDHGRRSLGLPAEELKLDLPRRIVKVIEELGRSNMGFVADAYGRLSEGKATPKIIPIYVRIDMLASKSMKKVDCQKGCDFCCHYHVYVTPLEVFAIAEEVCSWTIGRQNALISSLRNNVEMVQGLGVAQHRTLNLACSFLQEGACSILCRAAACLS